VRIPFERASTASTTHRHEYLDAYVRDLGSVVDLDAIRASGVHIGVDPLGGASVVYWDAIGERYGLDLEVLNHTVDPTFRFMSVGWDGQIRIDPSSPYAMAPFNSRDSWGMAATIAARRSCVRAMPPLSAPVVRPRDAAAQRAGWRRMSGRRQDVVPSDGSPRIARHGHGVAAPPIRATICGSAQCSSRCQYGQP